MILRRALILAIAATLLTGCAALRRAEPDSASVVITHVSHISQHWPLAGWLGERATNYGYQAASIAAGWRHHRWWWAVSDGCQLPGGDLSGPHEIFTASVGYTFWRRK